MKRAPVRLAVFMCLALFAAAGAAQSYPAKALRLIVPYKGAGPALVDLLGGHVDGRIEVEEGGAANGTQARVTEKPQHDLVRLSGFALLLNAINEA